MTIVDERNDNQIITERATFAGGCFWCTEAVFQRVKGVHAVASGYSGGNLDNPTYADVSTGKTGHAEAVQIEYDPNIISFEKLLDIFWATHDPTSLNRQGPDTGTQYRSTIFYHNNKQREQAEESKSKLGIEGKISGNIVTEIVPFQSFYKAEDYHQNYYDLYKNTNPYCSVVINPKIEKLISRFNRNVKDEYLKQDPKF